ncbi:MAG: DsbA family oxidoreductase [Sulfuritalea sp.]|nr:DsbA family oxidoreductase [Sulfuritalea sp.]
MNTLRIDIFSDVVCPWCFVGKRNLDKALEMWRTEQPDGDVQVRWQPFFLNPDTPDTGEPYRPFLEKKFGGPKPLQEMWQRVQEAGRPAGIEFAFEKIELRANTLKAHRLIHYAQKSEPDQKTIAVLIEALFAAQFLQGRYIGDAAVLADIAGECGLDRAAVLAYLESDDDTEDVLAGAAEARRLNINGVPFFIFNRRLGASGAHPPQDLLKAMQQSTEAEK